jgi:ribose 5-phosphate isomerase B
MIYLASDHAGFELKNSIAEYLTKEKEPFKDCGPFNYDETDDYPDYIIPAAKEASADPDGKGIVIGGSGQGEAIAANKVKGVRAALYYGGPTDIIVLSRTHNDANILSLGARFITKAEAVKAVKLWLQTSFSGEKRHERRIKKISEFELNH